MTHPTKDGTALLNRLIGSTTIGMTTGDAAQMRELLDELVRDWLREAGTDSDGPAVIDLLRSEFDTAMSGKPAPVRLQTVRAQVLDRRIRRLGVQTFALGKQLIDGSVARDEARTRGEVRMKEIDTVASDVRALTDATTRARLARDLQEASMEALYAIEGQAMSLRLNHYASDAQAPSVS